MGVRQNMKKLWNKIRSNGKKTVKEFKENLNKRDRRADAEISAEQVIEKETFPTGKRSHSNAELKSNTAKVRGSSGNKPAVSARGKTDKTGTDVVDSVKKNAAKKPASKRTRPTNANYRMIDPSDDSADAGKS